MASSIWLRSDGRSVDRIANEFGQDAAAGDGHGRAEDGIVAQADEQLRNRLCRHALDEEARVIKIEIGPLCGTSRSMVLAPASTSSTQDRPSHRTSLGLMREERFGQLQGNGNPRSEPIGLRFPALPERLSERQVQACAGLARIALTHRGDMRRPATDCDGKAPLLDAVRLRSEPFASDPQPRQVRSSPR